MPGEFVLERLGEGEHERLGAAIDAVEDLRADRHDRRDVDDRAGAARHEAGGGRIAQPHQRGDVEIDHQRHAIHVGLDQRRHAAEAGIVDQHRDRGIPPQYLLHAEQIVPVRQIGGQDVHGAARRVADATGDGVKPLGVAGDEDQVIAAPGEAIRVDRPDAARCAGHQRGSDIGHCRSPISPLAVHRQLGLHCRDRNDVEASFRDIVSRRRPALASCGHRRGICCRRMSGGAGPARCLGGRQHQEGAQSPARSPRTLRQRAGGRQLSASGYRLFFGRARGAAAPCARVWRSYGIGRSQIGRRRP
jgi:hypothetical protein